MGVSEKNQRRNYYYFFKCRYYDRKRKETKGDGNKRQRCMCVSEGRHTGRGPGNEQMEGYLKQYVGKTI